MHKQSRVAVVAISLIILPFIAFADESLTITTYYPSPYGVYNEMRAKRIAIGDDYIDNAQYCWSGTCTNTINSDADLIVEGNVGIGTTSPPAKLTVASGSGTDGVFPSGGTWAGMIYNTTDSSTSNGLFVANRWAAAASTAFQVGGLYSGVSRSFFMVNGIGNVGIGTTSPSYQLQLSTDSAGKLSTTAWTVTSDKRVKKDIRPYTNGLKIIKGINPVWFKYNGKAGFPDDNQNHIGVIAQEIIKVAPYTINTYKAKLNPEDKEETELLNFNPHALTFDLINSVKELDANIAKLNQENRELKKEVEDLKTRLGRLEEAVR